MAKTKRARCTHCGGEFAIAKDGTPYKHTLPGPDDTECPGSDVLALDPDNLSWHLYAGEVTTTDQAGVEHTSYAHILVGPSPSNVEPSEQVIHSMDQTLPLLTTFDHEPTHDERMAELPEQHRTPDPTQ